MAGTKGTTIRFRSSPANATPIKLLVENAHSAHAVGQRLHVKVSAASENSAKSSPSMPMSRLEKYAGLA